MKILCVIPARGGSTRYPNKPLATICGKPMVRMVWEHCLEVPVFDEVVIATDDKKIKSCAESFNAETIMTDSACETATERLYQVSQIKKADLYVMVNGDEPLVKAETIRKCIPESLDPDTFYVSNLMTDFENPVEVVDPTNLKIVTSNNGRCLFISRSPIPFPKGSMDFTYHKFVGVGAFTRSALEFYHKTPRGPIERIEENDSFRFVENDMPVYYINAHCKTLSVDTPKDRDAVEQWLSKSEILRV